MKRFVTALIVIPGLACLVGLTGCGKEDKPGKQPPPDKPPLARDGGGEKGGGGGPAKTIKAGTAKVSGRVIYDGEPLTPGSLVAVMKEHKDQAHCLMGSEVEKQDQTWIIGKDKGVKDVVVWINPPAGSVFEEGKAAKDAVLDQPHCVYVPHVVVMKPGQKLLIKNSAAISHNTKLDVDAFVNKPFGQTIAPKGEVTVSLKHQDKVITATCDFHGWMKAKIWTAPHQYVAVTDEDGKFVIENVPEGAELSVVAWHEAAGFFNNQKKGTPHTFKAGDNTLELKVKAP
jgi:hypothetical protein